METQAKILSRSQKKREVEIVSPKTRSSSRNAASTPQIELTPSKSSKIAISTPQTLTPTRSSSRRVTPKPQIESTPTRLLSRAISKLKIDSTPTKLLVDELNSKPENTMTPTRSSKRVSKLKIDSTSSKSSKRVSKLIIDSTPTKPKIDSTPTKSLISETVLKSESTMTPTRSSKRVSKLKIDSTSSKSLKMTISTPKIVSRSTESSLKMRISTPKIVSTLMERVATPKLNRSTRKRTSFEEEDESCDSSYEENFYTRSDYFQDVSLKMKKSDNTLKNLDLSTLKSLDRKSLEKNAVKEAVIDYYAKEMFSTIYGLLIVNHNVILSGLGSKKNLLEAFKSKWLMDEPFLQIHGFFAGLNLKFILIKLSNLFELDSIDEEDFFDKASSLERDIFLVIHSMDVLFKTDPKIKRFMIELYVRCKGKLHIVATVDHPNAALMFDLKDDQKLNLVCLEATTYESYQLERAYLKESKKNKKGLLSCFDEQTLAVNSIMNVYRSLPDNSQKVLILIFKEWINHLEFRKLTNRHSNNDEEDDAKGLTYAGVLDKCKQEFFVNSANAFKSRLVEFIDHKLIKKLKNSGTEYIVVLIEEHIIDQFFKEIDKSH